MEITHGPKDYAKLKQALAAAGYNGEKIVVLAASNYPSIWAEAQVATDTLSKIGFNLDLQALDWGSVVQRRASREPTSKGGWNIFYTFLGGFGNISPAPNIAIRGNGTAAWFGWPTNAQLEELHNAWFDAPDVAAQQKICEAMQKAFWQESDLCAARHVRPADRVSFLYEGRARWLAAILWGEKGCLVRDDVFRHAARRTCRLGPASAILAPACCPPSPTTWHSGCRG